jgi:hypothetical protein
VAELVKALGDFVAALLGLVGFVGKPRRRQAIRDDLGLLRELEGHEDFGRGTVAHLWLTNHILLEVAEFSGVDLRTVRRKPLWVSVVMACAVWIPLGWLTFHLIDIDQSWFAVLPAIPAGLFFIVTFPLIFNKEEVAPAPESGEGDEEPGTGERA